MKLKTKLNLLGATFLTAATFGVATPAFAQDPVTLDTCPSGMVRAGDGTCVEPESEEEEIVVTGSRLGQTTFSSVSPVGVITSEEVTLEGLGNTAEIVQQTPSTGGAFQVNTQLTGFVTTGGPGVNTISLRGLGAERTLVLLNGRRVGPAGTRGTVGPVDLNVIPSSLLQRVEILKDGASSIYGSDAIAGVVNFITRTDLDGLELNVFTNFNEFGGGEQHRISGSWGTTWTRGYFNVGAEYFQQEVLRNRQRDDTSCAADYLFVADPAGHAVPPVGNRIDYPNTDPGQEYGDDTYKCFNLFTRVLRASFQDLDDADGDGNMAELVSMDLIHADPGVVYPGPAGGNNSQIPGLVRQGRIGFPDTFPYAHQDHSAFGRSSSISPFETTTVVANLGFDVGDVGEFYSELMLNRRESIQFGARQFFPSVHPGGPGNTVGVPVLAFMLPIIPLKSDRDQTVDYLRGVAGMRGDFGDSGWDWDIHVQASRSDAEYGTDIIFNDRVLAVTGVAGCNQALITISGGNCADLAAGFIPWTDARILNGDFNADERAFLFTREVGKTTYDQQLAEVVFTGPAFDLPAGPLNVAVGASYRHEELDDTPGFNERNFNLWGSTSAGRTFGEDNVSEFFGEVGVPLLRDSMFAESLDLNLSARYVDYDSYGEGDTYKVGLNWQIMSDFRIRASTGTSFRAPALFELFLANQSSFVGQGAVDPCILWENSTNATLQANCGPAGSNVPLGYTQAGTASATVFAGGGAGLLNAEESEAGTVGIIWTPGDWGLSLAVDYFDIVVEDEITQFGAANIVAACYTSTDGPAFGNADPFCSLFVRNPGVNPPGGAGPFAIQSIQNNFINVAHQGNRGIDVNLRYERDVGPGTFTFSGEAVFMLEDVTQIFVSGLVDDFLGTTFGFRGPEIVARGSLRYDVTDWTYTWTMNYIGEGSDDSVFGGDTFRSTRYCTNGVLCSTANAPFVRFQQSTEPITYHDFSIRRRIDADGAEISLILGMNNIFDERPPAQSAGQFRRGTAALNGYDLVGRRAFVNVAVGW